MSDAETRRIAINLTSIFLTFVLGVASSLLHWSSEPVKREPPRERVRPVEIKPEESNVSVESETTPIREVVFGEGHLRVVSHTLQLESKRLCYKIDLTYPQIAGSNELYVRRLNKRINELVFEQYQWTLNPSKTDLTYYRNKWSGVYNSIDLDYEIRLANDSILSIYFIGYSYGIGAAHSVQFSFTLNYDLTRHRELQLSDIFKVRSSAYLQFISRYCANEFSNKSSFLFEEAIAPKADNFRSWNIMQDAIRFNFDACSVLACADQKQEVEIPFTLLQELLDRRALKTITKLQATTFPHTISDDKD
jgi:hypothetical protein